MDNRLRRAIIEDDLVYLFEYLTLHSIDVVDRETGETPLIVARNYGAHKCLQTLFFAGGAGDSKPEGEILSLSTRLSS